MFDDTNFNLLYAPIKVSITLRTNVHSQQFLFIFQNYDNARKSIFIKKILELARTSALQQISFVSDQQRNENISMSETFFLYFENENFLNILVRLMCFCCCFCM